MKTIFITKEVPYPIRGGVSLRNWQNINGMMKFGPVAIFSAANWNPNYNSLPNVTLWKHCNVEKQRSQWENWQRKLWWLRPLGDPDTDWAYSSMAAQELKQMMTDFQPDIVVFEQVWLHCYLSVVKNYSCHIIFDNHNIEAHLFAQQNLSSTSLTIKLKKAIQLNHLTAIEKQLTHQSDQVWVCSREDAELLQQMYGNKTPVYVVPNGVNVSSYDPVRLGQCSPPSELKNISHNMLFLGQLSYYPNTVAAELLIDKIYPKVKQKYPDCRLLLVGRVPTKKMLEAAKKDQDIIVTGTVPDVQPYLAAASVMVVPLLQGGGTRLKILEAFAAGCPVISTAKGAEGINVKDGEHLLIRNEIDDIVAGIEQLWSDSNLGAKLAKAAYQLAKQEYSWEANTKQLEKALKPWLSITP